MSTFRCLLMPFGSLLTEQVGVGGACSAGGVGGFGVEALEANSGGGGGVFICSSSLSSILHSTKQSSLTIIIFSAVKT